MTRVFLLIGVLLGLAGMTSAQERSSLWPDIPKATGEPHPEGNEFWRRNHMSLMRHDRDLTMHDGNRDIQASLKGCFECHAATDDAGQIVTYESEKHFCRACHDYAAVKVDCFMCHRSTPDGVDESAAAHAALSRDRGAGADENGLIAYLKQIAEPGQEIGQ